MDTLSYFLTQGATMEELRALEEALRNADDADVDLKAAA